MHLIRIFRDSWSLLKSEPKVFLPRLFTTMLYTFFSLYTANLSLRFAAAMHQAYARGMGVVTVVEPFAFEFLTLFSASLIIYAVDIISYAMYPSIVAAYRQGRPIRLRASLTAALRVWPTLAAFALLVFLVLAIFAAGTYTAYHLTLSRQSILPLLPLLIASVLFLLAFSVLFFFVIPVAVVERNGPLTTLKRSVSLGVRHRNDVTATVALFALLVFATFVVAGIYQFVGGALAVIAVILYLAGRLLQAVIYTYISVVNPALYFDAVDGTINKVRKNTT